MSRNKPRSTSYSPVLDIVIPTSGRFDMLGKCLEALREEAEDAQFSVIILDDFSDAEEKLTNIKLFDPNEYPEFSLMSKRLQQNVGFPGACNEGARMGKAQYIMFLNDDVVLQRGAISKVLTELQKPDIGVVGIKLLFPPDSSGPMRPAGRVQHVGLAVNIRGEVIHPLVGWSADTPKCSVSREVSAVTGACLSTKRELFNRFGFDAVYGKGTYEDVDYCLKVKQTGRRIYMLADAVGHHYVGSTAEKKQMAYPLQMNAMIFKTRWANTGMMQWDEHLFW